MFIVGSLSVGVSFTVRAETFADRFNVKSNVYKLLVIQNETAVENKRWLLHHLVDHRIVKALENVPFGTNDKSMRVTTCLEHVGTAINADMLLDDVVWQAELWVGEF